MLDIISATRNFVLQNASISNFNSGKGLVIFQFRHVISNSEESKQKNSTVEGCQYFY